MNPADGRTCNGTLVPEHVAPYCGPRILSDSVAFLLCHPPECLSSRAKRTLILVLLVRHASCRRRRVSLQQDQTWRTKDCIPRRN